MSAGNSRRDFLKQAGVLAAGIAASAEACAPSQREGESQRVSATSPRAVGIDRVQLDALAEVVLPASLGNNARNAAVTAFVAWVDAYDPVAEEMHGYGYADVRYLPPDPAPAWRAQLTGLDLLASRSKRKSFAQLDVSSREAIVVMALRGIRTDRLPAPLNAPHIALALLSHWASSPAAWNLALGVAVSPASCRPLGEALRKPLPIAGGASTARPA